MTYLHRQIAKQQGAKCSNNTLIKKLSYSNVSPLEQLLIHANLKVISLSSHRKYSMFDRMLPTRSTSSLARLLTRCACFVMVRCFCYHMPVGLHAIAIEHGVGTHRFRSTLCSALDFVSFPLGRTSVLGLEIGTRLPFVVWITGEIAPLSMCGKEFVCQSPQCFRDLDLSPWSSFNRTWCDVMCTIEFMAFWHAARMPLKPKKESKSRLSLICARRILFVDSDWWQSCCQCRVHLWESRCLL